MKYEVVIGGASPVVTDAPPHPVAVVVDDNIMALDASDEHAPPSKVFRLVDFHHEDGHRVAIVGEPGRKWIYAATFDSPIRLLKLPLEEQKHMRDITATTAAKAAKKMLKAGKRLGITDGAKAFLRSVV